MVVVLSLEAYMMCVCYYTEESEQKIWKELPATWSVQKPGEACKLTQLHMTDPEYIEVECNVRRTSCDQFFRKLEIVSVSETCEIRNTVS